MHKFTKHNAHIPLFSNNSITTKARVNNYISDFISSFNCHANHFLKINTASAPQTQIVNSKLNSVNNPDNRINHITMSANESSQFNPPASPQTPLVTFRTHSTPNTNKSTSVNNTQTSTSAEHRDIELSREKIFESHLNQLCAKSFLAVLISKDAVVEEIQDCVIQDDEARCREVSQYIHSFWTDLHVKSGNLCVDERVAIPNSIKNAVLE